MSVTNSFQAQAGPIPLAQLDQNFSDIFALAQTFTGRVTFTPSASGTAVIINANAGQASLVLNPADSASVGLAIQDPGANGSLLRLSTNNSGVNIQANGTSAVLNFLTGATTRVSIGNAGNVTVNAPSSGTALSVTGLANSYAQLTQGSNTTGQSFGLRIQSGSNASDSALTVRDTTNATLFLNVGGDGSISFGSVATTTTAPGAGGAGALPATPAGYVTITINGTARKLAYY